MVPCSEPTENFRMKTAVIGRLSVAGDDKGSFLKNIGELKGYLIIIVAKFSFI